MYAYGTGFGIMDIPPRDDIFNLSVRWVHPHMNDMNVDNLPSARSVNVTVGIVHLHQGVRVVL